MIAVASSSRPGSKGATFILAPHTHSRDQIWKCKNVGVREQNCQTIKRTTVALDNVYVSTRLRNLDDVLHVITICLDQAVP